MYEALGVAQGRIFSLIAQEVTQLGSGQDAAIAGIVSEDGVQLGSPQELPAELFNLHVVQAIVSGFVAPLKHEREHEHPAKNQIKGLCQGSTLTLNRHRA